MQNDGPQGMVGESMRWIEAGLADLEAIREFVRVMAGSLGAGADLTYDLVLAVDESTTNILLHGYCGAPGEVEVGVRKEGEDFVITVRDQAPPFDPTQVSPPDLSLPLEQRTPGGLGVHMVRSLTDRVIHRVRENGGNELTLIRRGR